jgi:maleylpyruvate isomerase
MDEQIAQSLARISDATGRLGAAADGLTDEQAAAPSLLPGWTRGHVLTHVARNADGLANLLRWARTGSRIPMYPSRPARELAADVRDSAAAFAAEAGRLDDDAWSATVEPLAGGPIPASVVPLMRLCEVEIHHLDLGTGYGHRDWPDGFADETLAGVAPSFQGRSDVPPCRVTVTGGPSYLIGPDAGEDGTGTGGPAAAGPGAAAAADGGPTVPEVCGPAHEVLAWLIGRDAGAGLQVRSASSLPVLPAWG